MARIALGALTTLNLSTHLDPMFIELYSIFSSFSTTTLAVTGSSTFQNVSYSGTLTGGTGVINIGSAQFYKDATGRIGLGTNAPLANIDLNAAAPTAGSVGIRVNDTVSATSVQLFRTGATYSYAGVGANQSWLYSQGAGTLNIGPDGAGTVRIVSNGASRVAVSSAGVVTPGADNSQTLGTGALRWSVVYAGTGAINTSDAREKTAVAPLVSSEIAAAKDLAREIGAFQFLDAVKAKGEGARLHIGMTVQRAIEIMEAHGLEADRYGFICYDEWEAEGDTPAGSRYGFRVDELLLFMARGFEARLSALEAA